MHPHRLTLIVAAAAVVVLALAGRAWVSAREDAARLHATLEAQSALIAQANARESARAAALDRTLADIAALKRSVQTPAQAARAIPSALPPLPAPIEIRLPASAPGNESVGAATPRSLGARPDAASAISNLQSQISSLASGQGTAAPPSSSSSAIAVIPQEDLKPLYDALQDCRACRARLDASEATVADERAKNAALTKERDAAVRAAKGGGFWTRVKRGAKWFVIGLAAGAALAAVH